MPNAVRFALFGVISLASCPAKAALAPSYQRLAEIRAVLDDQGVIAAMGAISIDSVSYVRTDLYRVTGARCHVDARIVGLPMPTGMVGARRFEVRAGQRVCTR